MARLVLNRRWTFILALGLSLVCCALAHHGVYASGERNSTAGGVIVDPGDGGGGGAGAGDPDAPVGNGKSPGSGGMVGGGSGTGGSTAVVSVPSGSVWMWRLRVVLQSLRSFYFRF